MDLRELPNESAARHPWERARARFFVDVVERHAGGRRPLRVLDMGAGDGFVGGALLERLPDSQVTCFDPNYRPEHLERFVAATGGRLRFTAEEPGERFDAVLLLDVIEHVPDDVALLRHVIEALLAPDGFVVVSVPAHMLLYSQHDVVLGHYRRYHRALLERALERSGLSPLVVGGLFHSLVVPRAAAVLGERLRGIRSVPPDGPPEDHADTALTSWRHGGLVTSAVDAVLALDNAGSRLLARLGAAPPGTSLWSVAKRTAP
jgi:SAM-dependent methyltransferase